MITAILLGLLGLGAVAGNALAMAYAISQISTATVVMLAAISAFISAYWFFIYPFFAMVLYGMFKLCFPQLAKIIDGCFAHLLDWLANKAIPFVVKELVRGLRFFLDTVIAIHTYYTKKDANTVVEKQEVYVDLGNGNAKYKVEEKEVAYDDLPPHIRQEWMWNQEKYGDTTDINEKDTIKAAVAVKAREQNIDDKELLDLTLTT
ncbi:MAG: hypothetical protein LBU65_01925 [Planctomycetaceae bacterium]|jgi:predicted membrane protein|nr:hypothetical protein [Planctomycetaceae bacterium]